MLSTFMCRLPSCADFNGGGSEEGGNSKEGEH